jgi:flagellin
LSDEQISANQLQVDSSLEAIDRIAQTTSFQGRRLLDGSLDFLTTNPDNALLRASGTLSSSVDAAATGSFTGAADVNATALISANGAAQLQFSATSAGTALNGITILVQQTDVATTASFASSTLSIRASVGATAADIASAVNALAATTQLSASGAAGAFFTTTFAANTSVTGVTSGGNFAHQIQLSATAGGARFNASVNVTVGASNAVAYDTGTRTLTITRSAGATATEIASAITAQGTFQATVVGNGAGILSAGTYHSATTSGTDSDTLILSAVTGGTSYNGLTVTVSTSDAAARAAYTTGTNTLTISRSAAATGSEIATAINTNGVFSATSSALGTLSATTYNNVTTGGATGSAALSDLKIEQANFGTAAAINVNVAVDTQATQATLIYSGGTLTADVVLQIGGKSGFETLTFGSGTTAQEIATGINQITDAIGISASVVSSAVSGSILRLESV